MASEEKGLPYSFEPGEKDPQGGRIKMGTTKNVRWAIGVGQNTCSTPTIAGGKVFIGSVRDRAGVLLCLDEKTGNLLWQWSAPGRDDVPGQIGGRKLNFRTMQASLGVCSSPLVDGKIYYPTTKHLWVLASGKELKVIGKISLGAPIWATPVAANGTLYIASKTYLWAVHNE